MNPTHPMNPPAHARPASSPALRRERHFSDRVMRCFADRPANVAQMLAAAVARDGSGEAVVCGDERLSWQQVDELCARLAGAMHGQGVGAGDRVALLLDNGVRSQAPELIHALNRSRSHDRSH